MQVDYSVIKILGHFDFFIFLSQKFADHTYGKCQAKVRDAGF